MTKTIILDTEATSIEKPSLTEAAWIERESNEPLSITNPFHDPQLSQAFFSK